MSRLHKQESFECLHCTNNKVLNVAICCAVATFKTLLFVQSRHSKLYCLCSRDIQNFIVCAVATFKTLLFVQSRHSKLYCLCSRDIQNFIVCAVATFKTLLFVQSSHSKLFSLRVPSGAPYQAPGVGQLEVLDDPERWGHFQRLVLVIFLIPTFFEGGSGGEVWVFVDSCIITKFKVKVVQGRCNYYLHAVGQVAS